jgi:hypothetical protein
LHAGTTAVRRTSSSSATFPATAAMSFALDQSGNRKERDELKKGKGNARVLRQRREGARSDGNLHHGLRLR